MLEKVEYIDAVGQPLSTRDFVRVYQDLGYHSIRRVVAIGEKLDEPVVIFDDDSWAFTTAVQRVTDFCALIEHFLEIQNTDLALSEVIGD
jgi:hypothetical protein